MRQRPPSSRPAVLLPFLLVLVVGLVGACAAGRGGPDPSSDSLPTGLVGPVAPTVGPQALRYVALGDPYTFGDGVRQMDRWPNQLVRILRPELDLDLVANLAGRSIASLDVIDEQLPELAHLEPRFVTLQVGANDVCFWMEDRPTTYRANMAAILDTVLAFVASNRIVVLTTPDFSLMPGTLPCPGERAEQSARVAQLNEVLSEVAAERDVAVVDVSPIADRVPLDRTLVAPDGTHPSRKQYAGWADLVATTVRGLFREGASDTPASGALASGAPASDGRPARAPGVSGDPAWDGRPARAPGVSGDPSPGATLLPSGASGASGASSASPILYTSMR